jgi:hypothetical protein
MSENSSLTYIMQYDAAGEVQIRQLETRASARRRFSSFDAHHPACEPQQHVCQLNNESLFYRTGRPRRASHELGRH